MPIEQYNQDPQDQKPTVAPVVDAEAMAEAIYRRMAQSGQAPPTQASRDELVEAINTLQYNEYEKPYIDGMALMGEAAVKKAARQIRQEMAQVSVQSRQDSTVSEARKEINAHLRSIYRNHPELKEDDGSIRAEFDAYLEANPSVIQKALRTGEVPSDLIAEKLDEIADKKLSRLGKKRDKEDSQQPTHKISSNANKIQPATPGDKGEDGEFDPDSLSRDQRAAYRDMVLSNKKYLKMSDEDAKKDAYKTARQLPEDYLKYERQKRLAG